MDTKSTTGEVQDTRKLKKHPVYWFYDGSLVLHAQGTLYKLHDSLLKRLSPYIASVGVNSSVPMGLDLIGTIGDNVSYVILGSDRQVLSADVEALLEHLYHDHPLGPNSSFDRISSILRCSSPQQLDVPILHTLARKQLDIMFSDKRVSEFHPDHLFEALSLARVFQLPSVLKVVLYHIMVSTNLDPEDHEDTNSTPPEHISNDSQADSSSSIPHFAGEQLSEHSHKLAEADIQLCKRLMERIIEHFTPILFTPAATPHMACTDVFADTWMVLVIQPGIENGGVYKPIETLEGMKNIDWAQHGLCSGCVLEKGKEWTEEQDNVWNLIGVWSEEKVAS